MTLLGTEPQLGLCTPCPLSGVPFVEQGFILQLVTKPGVSKFLSEGLWFAAPWTPQLILNVSCWLPQPPLPRPSPPYTLQWTKKGLRANWLGRLYPLGTFLGLLCEASFGPELFGVPRKMTFLVCLKSAESRASRWS